MFSWCDSVTTEQYQSGHFTPGPARKGDWWGMGQHRCHWLMEDRARGFAIRHPAGREAAIVPCSTRPVAAGTALPELEAGHQNPLQNSDTLGEGPGSDRALQGFLLWAHARTPLYSRDGGMGGSVAHRWGGGINKSTEMVLL